MAQQASSLSRAAILVSIQRLALLTALCAVAHASSHLVPGTSDSRPNMRVEAVGGFLKREGAGESLVNPSILTLAGPQLNPDPLGRKQSHSTIFCSYRSVRELPLRPARFAFRTPELMRRRAGRTFDAALAL